MKPYAQACGLAKTLDLVGERWTLLIVRELLIREACRYTDLKRGLPGIATNLLAERLRELEALGLLSSEAAPPPVATTMYRLTPRGRGLEAALLLLGRWGAPLVGEGGEDVFQAHWMVLPLRLRFAGRRCERALRVAVLAAEEAVAIEASQQGIEVRLGPTQDPDVTVLGEGQSVLNFLLGRAPAKRLAAPRVQGDVRALSQLLKA
jgi:DNA-binding HxlR family transcriptional regulator